MKRILRDTHPPGREIEIETAVEGKIVERNLWLKVTD